MNCQELASCQLYEKIGDVHKDVQKGLDLSQQIIDAVTGVDTTVNAINATVSTLHAELTAGLSRVNALQQKSLLRARDMQLQIHNFEARLEKRNGENLDALGSIGRKLDRLSKQVTKLQLSAIQNQYETMAAAFMASIATISGAYDDFLSAVAVVTNHDATFGSIDPNIGSLSAFRKESDRAVEAGRQQVQAAWSRARDAFAKVAYLLSDGNFLAVHYEVSLSAAMGDYLKNQNTNSKCSAVLQNLDDLLAHVRLEAFDNDLVSACFAGAVFRTFTLRSAMEDIFGVGSVPVGDLVSASKQAQRAFEKVRADMSQAKLSQPLLKSVLSLLLPSECPFTDPDCSSAALVSKLETELAVLVSSSNGNLVFALNPAAQLWGGGPPAGFYQCSAKEETINPLKGILHNGKTFQTEAACHRAISPPIKCPDGYNLKDFVKPIVYPGKGLDGDWYCGTAKFDGAWGNQHTRFASYGSKSFWCELGADALKKAITPVHNFKLEARDLPIATASWTTKVDGLIKSMTMGTAMSGGEMYLKASDGALYARRQEARYCSCTTPNAGRAGKNQYWCDNGEKGFCASNQYCTADSFLHGYWSTACSTTPVVDTSHCGWQCYVDRYGDLKRAFGSNLGSAKWHYIIHGRFEGRHCTCPGVAIPTPSPTVSKCSTRFGINFCNAWCNTPGKWPCGTSTLGGHDGRNTDNVDYKCSCSGCNGCPSEATMPKSLAMGACQTADNDCQWVFEPSPWREGAYYIRTSDGATYIEATWGAEDGKPLNSRTCPMDKDLPNCQWVLEQSATRKGAYYIRASEGTTYIHSQGGFASGNPLTMHPCPKTTNHPNCQWMLSTS